MNFEDQDLGRVTTSLCLVLAVARLGELDQAGWWRCHGLSPAGEYVLSSLFPKTWQVAALELDIVSATKRHEELLPRDSALHLFSDQLPFRRLALAWLAERKTDDSHSFISELRELDELGTRTWIEGQVEVLSPTTQRVGGGSLLGSITTQELEQGTRVEIALRTLAAGYLTLTDEFIPPYFDLVS